MSQLDLYQHYQIVFAIMIEGEGENEEVSKGASAGVGKTIEVGGRGKDGSACEVE